MAKSKRRYNSRSRQYASRPSSSGGAKWVVIGILVGALGMYFLWPKVPSPHGGLPLTEHQVHSKLAAKKHISPVANKKPAEYDFYTMLPKMEVKTVENRPLTPPPPTPQPAPVIRSVAPQQASAAPAVPVAATPAVKSPLIPVTASVQAPAPPAPAPEKTPPPVKEKASETYVVQVANVRNYAEADRLKAELTMLGFDVSLQDYTVNGQTWNRVLAGSFSSKQAAIQQQKRLKQNNIGSTLIRE